MHPAAWAVWEVNNGAYCRCHFLMIPYTGKVDKSKIFNFHFKKNLNHN